MRVDGQHHAPGALPHPRKECVSIVQGTGWALGPVCTGAENLRSLDTHRGSNSDYEEYKIRLIYHKR
jgi:hypothetical protein